MRVPVSMLQHPQIDDFRTLRSSLRQRDTTAFLHQLPTVQQMQDNAETLRAVQSLNQDQFSSPWGSEIPDIRQESDYSYDLGSDGADIGSSSETDSSRGTPEPEREEGSDNLMWLVNFRLDSVLNPGSSTAAQAAAAGATSSSDSGNDFFFTFIHFPLHPSNMNITSL